MGTDFSGRFLLGVYIRAKDLRTTRLQSNCEHLPTTLTKLSNPHQSLQVETPRRYCPTCGREAGLIKTIHWPEWLVPNPPKRPMLWNEGEAIRTVESPGGLILDVEEGTDRDYIIIGRQLSKADLGRTIARGAVKIPALPQRFDSKHIDTEVRRFLREVIGKPDIGEFGFWFSMFTSY